MESYASRCFLLFLPLMLCWNEGGSGVSIVCGAFQPLSQSRRTGAFRSRNFANAITTNKSRRGARLHAQRDEGGNNIDNFVAKPVVSTTLALSLLLSPLIVTTTAPTTAVAYDPSDYASETVTAAVKALKDASGNPTDTLNAYQNIAEIITEGKGVGGSVNFKGVELDRGFVADEDTSIYNPGLALLTESEKERLVEACQKARQVGLAKNQWSEDNEQGYEFLRGKLDPFHVAQLRGYLSVVPFVAGILYLAVLAVQQLARGIFPIAYFVGAALFFAPAIFLVLFGG